MSSRRSPKVRLAVQALFDAKPGRIVLYEEIAAELRKFNIDDKQHSIAQTIASLRETNFDKYYFAITKVGYVCVQAR